MKQPFTISPMTRLSLAMDGELKLDKTGVLAGLKEKYIEQLAVAEQKKDRLFRSLFYIDATLAFLITGSNFKLPVLDITSSEIPAVIEAATLASSVTVVIMVMHFITWAAYEAISRQFGIAEARPSAIDPEFISAAESQVELTLKLLRTKLNIWGQDFHEPGRGFRIYSAIVYFLIGALFVLFPIVHFFLLAMSLAATYLAHGLGLITAVYFLIVIILNILAVLIAVGSYKDFKFYVELPDETGDAA